MGKKIAPTQKILNSSEMCFEKNSVFFENGTRWRYNPPLLGYLSAVSNIICEKKF